MANTTLAYLNDIVMVKLFLHFLALSHFEVDGSWHYNSVTLVSHPFILIKNCDNGTEAKTSMSTSQHAESVLSMLSCC